MVGHRHDGALELTFDDGPGPWTLPICDVLARHGLRGTFFMVGNAVRGAPEIAAEVQRQGHAIGNHTQTHARLTRLSSAKIHAELASARLEIQRATGIETDLVRAPFGAVNRRVTRVIEREGWKYVGSDIDPRDYALPGAETIAEHVLRHRSGTVLLHDGGYDRSQTLEALGRICAAISRSRD